MRKIKKRIKKIIPARVLYIYQCVRLLPKYLIVRAKSVGLEIPPVNFMDNRTTVDKIINERMSLGRFGDGEFMWMLGKTHNSFQDYSEKLAQDLRDAFQADNSKLLIGIPYGVFNSKGCNLYAKMHWECIRVEFLSRLRQFISFEKVYCNASITRPYIDYKDRKFSTESFINLRRIWDNKHIVIVEGEKTKLGIGNDLFENALSIKRILCPAENAYYKMDEIKASIRKNVEKDTLILGALGPTASILAHHLTEEGYQFVDIGHVDIEYMWYLKKEILRTPIEGKYVNESGEKGCSGFYDCDDNYLDSIIDRIM